MEKRIFYLVLFLMVFVDQVFAMSSLKLPYPKGENWECSQGNATDPNNYKPLLDAKKEFDVYGSDC